MRLATYIIGQGDNIKVLAQKLLGDSSLENTLVSINQLRYPFISDNPIDQFSRPKGNVLLTLQYINASTLIINNPNSIVILPNDTVFVSQGSIFSSAVIQSISGNTVVLSTPLLGAFDQAATVVIFVNQQNIKSQVLITGSTLLYPPDPTQSLNLSNSLLLGTDWRLDGNGYLLRASNEVATVSGLNNLTQALSLRLVTPLGSLLLHSDYGNGLFDIIGEGGQPYFTGLAKYYIEQCILQEIRVQSATVTDLTFLNGTIIANVTVFPVGAQDPISMPIKIPIGGVA